MRDLSGEWEGHYVQSGTAYKMVASIMHIFEWVSGRTTDFRDESPRTLVELEATGDLTSEQSEQIVAELQERFPNVEKAAVQIAVGLPPGSVIEGRVDGETIRFTKTYLGEQVTSCLVHGERIGEICTDTVAVDYRGTLDPDGNTIEGMWVIRDPGSSEEIDWGAFVLRRILQ